MNHIRQDGAAHALFRRSGVRFEVACDVIGAVISHYAEFIAIEQEKPEPGTQEIALACRLMTELRDIREELDSDDLASVEATIERLGPLARHLFVNDPAGVQESSRREQSDPADARLAVDDSSPAMDDLTWQAAIIRGEFDRDQATAWDQRRFLS